MRIQYEHTNCYGGCMGVYIVFCPIIVNSCLFKVVKIEKYFQLKITIEVDIIEKIIHDVVE